MGREKLLAGNWVTVRSAQEILSTLDPDGTLQGLPFMPEMLDWCGKPFRIQRRVEKTCVDVGPPVYSNRRFPGSDVVILEGPRCDGRDHDGCKRGCRIFWKADWLRSIESADRPVPVPEPQPRAAALSGRLRVKADEHRYFCQSTELLLATEAFPGKKKPWMLRVAFREIRNGDRSLAELSTLFARWCRQMLHNVLANEWFIRGTGKQTPTASLDLKPGEIVRIKSRDQIVETLNDRGRNRGMGISTEMLRCCGKEAEVRARVERIIEERSGKMRELQNTVMLWKLHGHPALCEECLCAEELGDCPRGELMYWREIWLERTTGAAAH